MIEIFKEVSKELNIPVDIVSKVVNIYMSYVRLKISRIPYKSLTTYEGVKTNIILPGFGKLVVKNKSNRKLKYEKSRKS